MPITKKYKTYSKDRGSSELKIKQALGGITKDRGVGLFPKKYGH
jgi:hypothetical protein